MVFEQGLEGLEHLHLTGDTSRRLSLPLHHSHPQRALVTRHQTLQMLKQELDGTGQKQRK